MTESDMGKTMKYETIFTIDGKVEYDSDNLRKDPKAPSNEPKDYNDDGEYVPDNGPSDNPEDYNFNGEYKPADEMTKEEIEEELGEMFGQ